MYRERNLANYPEYKTNIIVTFWPKSLIFKRAALSLTMPYTGWIVSADKESCLRLLRTARKPEVLPTELIPFQLSNIIIRAKM